MKKMDNDFCLFVKTSDEETANLLRASGLTELEKEADKWVFINEPNKIQFSNDKMKDAHTTDILHF